MLDWISFRNAGDSYTYALLQKFHAAVEKTHIPLCSHSKSSLVRLKRSSLSTVPKRE